MSNFESNGSTAPEILGTGIKRLGELRGTKRLPIAVGRMLPNWAEWEAAGRGPVQIHRYIRGE
jgi:hypothetical protein